MNLNVEKNSGIVEKVLSIVLVALMAAAIFYAYATFFMAAPVKVVNTQQSGIQANLDFINSSAFTSLKYIPDSSIFDEVTTINFTTGTDDPFAGS
jgi:hypothetical protein